MSKGNTRIAREDKTVSAMIALYCHKQHRGRGLCVECRELAEYAREKLLKCPFMEGKTVCSLCKVHCYKPAMREKIRAVMRFSGPRMIYRHPVMALQHIIDRRRKEAVQRPPFR